MNRQLLNGIDVILFDVDNTLYPREIGLWQEIDARIRTYTARALGLPPDEAEVVQKRFWIEHGTTIAGLMAEYALDPGPYLAFVHDLDLRPYLTPNRHLDSILRALPQRKAAFTNATSTHARNVLAALGVLDHFDALVGFDDVGYISKPDPRAYENCLKLVGVQAERCLFIEDSATNLAPARALGMKTIFLGPRQNGIADATIERIEDIGPLFGISVAERGA